MASLRIERRLAVLRKLRDIAGIGDVESQLILARIGESAVSTTGMELIRLGAELNEPRMIMSGWAGLAVAFPDGRRQLLDILLPGDLIGFSAHVRSLAKASVICLTPVESVGIPALAECLGTPERFPGARLFLETAQDQFESRLMNQIVRNGAQNADEKLCSFMLELYSRLAVKGLAERDSFELPISQVAMADALGITTVHINRTLKNLRREQIIQIQHHRLHILNWPAFRRRAGNLCLPEEQAYLGALRDSSNPAHISIGVV